MKALTKRQRIKALKALAFIYFNIYKECIYGHFNMKIESSSYNSEPKNLLDISEVIFKGIISRKFAQQIAEKILDKCPFLANQMYICREIYYTDSDCIEYNIHVYIKTPDYERDTYPFYKDHPCWNWNDHKYGSDVYNWYTSNEKHFYTNN